jgi:hypothetical protein
MWRLKVDLVAVLLRKIVFTLKKTLGILLKKEMFLIASAKRKRNTNAQNRRKMVQSLIILLNIATTTNLPPNLVALSYCYAQFCSSFIKNRLTSCNCLLDTKKVVCHKLFLLKTKKRFFYMLKKYFNI